MEENVFNLHSITRGMSVDHKPLQEEDRAKVLFFLSVLTRFSLRGLLVLHFQFCGLCKTKDMAAEIRVCLCLYF